MAPTCGAWRCTARSWSCSWQCWRFSSTSSFACCAAQRISSGRCTTACAKRRRPTTRSHSKSRFLAYMSHELRTPLNAIIGFSDILNKQMFGALPPRYAGYSKHIHDSGNLLLDVINDILDLSKVESGKLELSEADVDAHELMSSAVAMMHGRAIAAEVKLTMAPEGPRPVLRADPRAVKQVMINLLSNAIKYTPEGGSIVAGIDSDERGVRLWVRDTGVGIAKSEIDRVFDPFHRGDVARSKQIEGTGLGLPIGRRLMELHGGGLELHSEPGVGTLASAIFPPVRVIGQAPVAADTAAAGRPAGVTAAAE
ncbi:MAG: HAMP domain-containing histidine kinase [Alphaproteobacteria bacterium]|nr:HAMP domain-containing histidine kinase [Alphaproteobacteria bacterium]